MNKTCTKCKIEKPIEDFLFRTDRQKYLSRCKECERVWAKEYKANLPKEEVNRKAMVRYNANPDAARRQRRASSSKLSIHKYRELEAAHGGSCNICGTTEKVGGRHLAYDHNHNTGNFRGFLCMNCNQGLGKFFDNIEILQLAIQYLHKGESTWQILSEHLELKYEDT